MKNLKKLARRFWSDERGLEMSEYAVLLALIVAVVILFGATLGDAIVTKFTEIAAAITAAP